MELSSSTASTSSTPPSTYVSFSALYGLRDSSTCRHLSATCSVHGDARGAPRCGGAGRCAAPTRHIVWHTRHSSATVIAFAAAAAAAPADPPCPAWPPAPPPEWPLWRSATQLRAPPAAADPECNQDIMEQGTGRKNHVRRQITRLTKRAIQIRTADITDASFQCPCRCRRSCCLR